MENLVKPREEYKESLDKMSNALHHLDNHVIGLAKIYGGVELIVKRDSDVLVTYRIGALLGSSTSYWGVQEFKGEIYMFPDGMSLAELKRDPFGLDKFCKEHKI